MEHIIPNDILSEEKFSFDRFREEVLNDYRLACESREASLLGRKEVLTGKAKFGIFGDGKEVPQIALSKFFQPGDFYAGYYRDQTEPLIDHRCGMRRAGPRTSSDAGSPRYSRRKGLTRLS